MVIPLETSCLGSFKDSSLQIFDGSLDSSIKKRLIINGSSKGSSNWVNLRVRYISSNQYTVNFLKAIYMLVQYLVHIGVSKYIISQLTQNICIT